MEKLLFNPDAQTRSDLLRSRTQDLIEIETRALKFGPSSLKPDERKVLQAYLKATQQFPVPPDW